MNKLIIQGGTQLNGTIQISGAKNAALPLMASSLLTDEPLTLTNMPMLADIKTMRKLLEQHGVQVNSASCIVHGHQNTMHHAPSTMTLSASNIYNLTAPYELVRTMRASVLVLGPLLARFGAAKVSLPGGCAIGTRPVDLHLKALEAMGAQIELVDGYVHASVAGKLKGAVIQFEKVSVGATENILMAATLAEGTTTIYNAAREPEVTDLANCFSAMGARIEGIGTNRLTIEGVDSLHGATYRVIADRIEAGSFLCAAAMCGGELELIGVEAATMKAVIEKLEEAGVSITETERGLRVKRTGALHGIDVMTQAYSGFPTDMQAQFMAMLSMAEGASMITETIFENRFMHAPELMRMGARINVHGASAMVRGVPQLNSAEVMATDLRASISLVMAAMVAKGETTIHRIYHLDRGYERLEELCAVGAKIERVAAEKQSEELQEAEAA